MTSPLTLKQLETISLTGRGARVMTWAYFATLAVLAFWSLNEVRTPGPTIVALVLFAGVCAVLTLDTGATLSLWATLITVGVWPAVAALVSWQLTSGGGFSQWFLGAATACLFFVSLRGRIGWAWIGFALVSLVTLMWGATTDIGIGTAALLMAKQFPILVVGTLFAIGLRRTGSTIQHLTTETSARAAIEAADVAATAERDRRLVELDAFATPLLSLLVSGAPLADDDRREFAVAEAELRDGLRARGLAVAPVIEAARAARRRGIDVVLLDDSDPAAVEPRNRDEVVSQLCAALDSAVEGRVVARLLPPGRGSVATLLVETADTSHTVQIGSC